MTELQKTLMADLVTDHWFLWELINDESGSPAPDDPRASEIIRQTRDLLDRQYVEVLRRLSDWDAPGPATYETLPDEEARQALSARETWAYEQPSAHWLEITATEAGEQAYYGNERRVV